MMKKNETQPSYIITVFVTMYRNNQMSVFRVVLNLLNWRCWSIWIIHSHDSKQPNHRFKKAYIKNSTVPNFPMGTLLTDNRFYFCDWFKETKKNNINDFLLWTQIIWVKAEKQIDQCLCTNWYWLLWFEIRNFFSYTFLHSSGSVLESLERNQ